MPIINHSTGTIHGRRVFDLHYRQFGHIEREVVYGFRDVCRVVEYTVALDDGLTVRRWADEIADDTNIAILSAPRVDAMMRSPCDTEDGPEAA